MSRRDWTTDDDVAVGAAIELLFVLAELVAFLVFSAGWWMARQTPVCHAPTEDSVVLDCDYRDGGWYQK